MSNLVRPRKAFWITGRKYYQTELAISEAGEHDAKLVREPDNEFDSNALRVDINGHKIGYIPKDKAEKLAAHMDSLGTPEFDCQVLVIAPDEGRVQWGAQFLGVYRDA